MSFIQRNIWGIGFVVVLGGALLAMGFASKHASAPTPDSNAANNASFEITSADHVKGSQNAKVTLVEFGDFQCPACAAYHPLVEQLMAEFPNDLRFVFKHFPLRSIHFQAQNASQAAAAAGLQGKFFEMHDELYANQNAWANVATKVETFEPYAQKIGLDINKFRTDFNSDGVKDKIQADVALAAENNLSGTPTFFVNGNRIQNPQTYEAFKEVIQNALNTASAPATQ